MKPVKFTYLHGGSIELIVKASVFKGGAVILDEVYDADTCRPFNYDRISIHTENYPYESELMGDWLISMAIEEAKNNV